MPGTSPRDSGVAIDISADAFELAEPMQAIGSALGVDPMQFILGGGDDHAIVATFPAGTALPEGFRAIGSVSEPGEAGAVVTVDGAAYDGPRGLVPLPVTHSPSRRRSAPNARAVAEVHPRRGEPSQKCSRTSERRTRWSGCAVRRVVRLSGRPCRP